jgi:uncharacterized membrane protein
MKSKHLLSQAIILSWVYVLTACSLDTTKPNSASVPASEPGNYQKTQAWQCQNNGYVVTSKAGEQEINKILWVFLPGQTVQLIAEPNQPDGAYASETMRLLLNGNNARLEKNGTTDQCSEDRRWSIREAAKLRGVDFWATGNEPPWQLEISSATILLKTGYTNDQHEFPSPEPATDRATRTTRYKTRNANEQLNIIVSGQSCSDSMSGEGFASKVTLELDGRKLMGCGLPLH